MAIRKKIKEKSELTKLPIGSISKLDFIKTYFSDYTAPEKQFYTYYKRGCKTMHLIGIELTEYKMAYYKVADYLIPKTN